MVAMYVLLSIIWNRVRSSLKKRMLVIDEAWTLMLMRIRRNSCLAWSKRAK